MFPIHNQHILYLSGFPKETSIVRLKQHFDRVNSTIGIESIDIGLQTRKGLARVVFASAEDAKKAAEEVNYSLMNGHEVQLTAHRPGEIRNYAKESVYVENLPLDMRSKELHRLASEFGEVMQCRVNYDVKGMSKGSGYVQFSSKESAYNALQQLNEQLVHGQEIRASPFIVRGTESGVARNCTLFVRGIPEWYGMTEVIELFSGSEHIVDVTVPKRKNDCRKNRGIAFISFSNVESMAKAEEELGEETIEGNRLYVARAISKDEQKAQRREERYLKHKDCNLYIKNLPENCTDEMLRKALEPFGKVYSARVMIGPEQEEGSGKIKIKPKGFGFVCFSNHEEALRALTAIVKGHKVMGQSIIAYMAEKKEERMARLAYKQHLPQPRAQLASITASSFKATRYNGNVHPRDRPLPVTMLAYPRSMNRQFPRQASAPLTQPKYVPAPAKSPTDERGKDEVGEEKEVDRLGEELYRLIAAEEPKNAGKITGMLLELGVEKVKAIIGSPEELKNWVSKARDLLSTM